MAKSQSKEEIQKQAAALAQKMIKENKTIKEVADVSQDLLEEIYGLAYAYYAQGNVKESTALFYFLSNIDPKEYRFVYGLAASYHRKEDFERAALTFATAIMLNDQDPNAAYYAADSLLKLDQKEDALEFLQAAIDISGKKIEFASLKEKCQLVYNNLIENQNS